MLLNAFVFIQTSRSEHGNTRNWPTQRTVEHNKILSEHGNLYVAICFMVLYIRRQAIICTNDDDTVL